MGQPSSLMSSVYPIVRPLLSSYSADKNATRSNVAMGLSRARRAKTAQRLTHLLAPPAPWAGGWGGGQPKQHPNAQPKTISPTRKPNAAANLSPHRGRFHLHTTDPRFPLFLSAQAAILQLTGTSRHTPSTVVSRRPAAARCCPPRSWTPAGATAAAATGSRCG